MRSVTILLIVAALVGTAVLAAPEPEAKNYREIVKELDAWVKEREEDDDLEKETLDEVKGLVAALGKLDAKQLYEGLSTEERKKLRELLDKEERLEGYADRVLKITEDVGLSAEESDELFGIYEEYREELRKVWRDREGREKVEEKFEKALVKAFGRKKAKAIANAIRRTSRRGR